MGPQKMRDRGSSLGFRAQNWQAGGSRNMELGYRTLHISRAAHHDACLMRVVHALMFPPPCLELGQVNSIGDGQEQLPDRD